MGLGDDDFGLLRRYAEDRDESAFAELMRRHADLVYSASARRVGNRSMAEDVTQATFMILARKAKSIRQRSSEPLSAWLLNTVRYASANAIKMERRRRNHEQAAAMSSACRRPGACSPDPTEVIVWQEIAEQLDDAVLGLSRAHRQAVLLRYFENQPIGEMAVQLHLSEGAVNQLLHRAIEKLRRRLAGRGVAIVAIDSLAFSRLLESHVITSAPAAVKAACGAIGTSTTGALGVGATTSIAKGAIKMMAWTKAQMAAALLAAVAIGGAGGALVIRSMPGSGPASLPAKNQNGAAGGANGQRAANNTTPGTDRAAQIPQGDPDKLAPGDLVDVEVSDLSGPATMTSIPVRISADGAVRLIYLSEPVPLAGMDRTQAQGAIVDAYRKANLISRADIFVRRLEAAGTDSLGGRIQPFDLVRVATLDMVGPGIQDVRISRVSGNGTIVLPYVGPLPVAGMSEWQAGDAIAKAYKDANLVAHAGVSVLKLEAAPANAARLALPDGPIRSVPELLKPLYNEGLTRGIADAGPKH